MNGWSEREPALTPRQRDVLEQLALGRTNIEIADSLGIGYETVKMHVAHILAALDVSSREEAAVWWRTANQPLTRFRRALLAVPLAKAAGIGLAAVALVGSASLVAFALASGGDDPSPSQPAVAETPTGTATASPSPRIIIVGPTSSLPTPTPLPNPVGFQAAAAALRFDLISLEGDALETRVTLAVPDSAAFIETGPALVFVTDSEGNRQRLQGGQRNTGQPGIYQGSAISSRPGTVVIEVQPVREYVVPALKDGEPTPTWARYEIPWNGYTGDLVSLPLPAPVPFSSGTLSITELLVTSLQVRLQYRIEMPPGTDVPHLVPSIALFTPAGEPIHGSGSGHGDGNVATGVRRYEPVSGTAILVIREEPPGVRCVDNDDQFKPTPTASPPPGTEWSGTCAFARHDISLDEARTNFGYAVAEISFVVP